MTEPVHSVRVLAIRWEGTDVCSFTLAALDGTAFAAVDPGAHIDVVLPNGLMRSYSLSGRDADGHYRITVARDVNSTGGSALLTTRVRPGDLLQISAPRNNFPLHEGASRSVFIAGGIGITPFVPMLQRLNERGRPWRLHYGVRTRDRAALLAEIECLAKSGQGEVLLNIDEEAGGKMLDLAGIVGALGSAEHVYCCGPMGMLDGFRAACTRAGLEPERVHFEYFKSNIEAAAAGGFTVTLARSGRTIAIPEGKTILEALLEVGLDLPFSCREGVCGSCETKVLAGEPDHRDLILSESERQSGRTMMICCSGSKSSNLTLDI